MSEITPSHTVEPSARSRGTDSAGIQRTWPFTTTRHCRLNRSFCSKVRELSASQPS
jgi:hypothetical protein